MKTKAIGTRHGAATRAKIEAASDLAHRAMHTLGSGVDAVAGSVTDAGINVVGYVRGFARGLLRSPNV